MARDTSRRSKGVSLAKGPVGIIGLIGLIYGLGALILSNHGFTLHVPHGAAHGKQWIGLEVNGWSELLFIAAGLLLLISAPPPHRVRLGRGRSAAARACPAAAGRRPER